MEINLSHLQSTVDGLVPIVQGLVVTTNNLVKSCELNRQFQDSVEPKVRELWEKRGSLDELMNGTGKRLGLLAEHRIMWRIHVWILCAISSALGIAGTILIQHLMKL